MSLKPLAAVALFTAWAAFGQTTTPVTIENLSGMTTSALIDRPVSVNGNGTVSPFGGAALTFNGYQDEISDLTQGTFTFFLNRVDSFNLNATPQMVYKGATLTLPGSIVGGTGAFSGATGSVNYTFSYTATASSSGTFTLTGTGSITVGQTTTAITLAGFSGVASVNSILSGTLQTSATGSLTPFGNVTVNFTGMGFTQGSSGPIQGALTFVFNPSDSFVASFSTTLNLNNPTIVLPCAITGGTGAFNGASGSLNASFTFSNTGTFALTGSGSITQPQVLSQTITSVTTAFGAAAIAQNDYIVIKGANLVPATTPATGAIWSAAPSFANGLMPTQLGGVSVMVNNKPAFVYFYCSAATDPACPQDQLNILTPLDNTAGPVPVVVTSAGVSTLPFFATLQPVAPSLLLFSPTGYVVATHLDNSLLGPIGLYPSSTPAKPGEQIVLYAVAFGLPATPLVNGSAVQSGSLPVLPVCQVGGTAAGVVFAGLVGPGLYQLNVTIPLTASNGDNSIGCSYSGSTTPAGNLITV
jgi:uncharacterized protein (TIGR03437 family)